MTKNEESHRERTPIKIRYHLRPGDIGYISYLHGILYAEEHGFDLSFEVYVAEYLVEFIKSLTDRERLWIVEKEGEILGSIAIVNFSEHEAQLRWLLVHPTIRCQGIGRTLVTKALEFCRENNYSSVFLWTVNILIPATRLYESVGFNKIEEKTHELWGAVRTEERYNLEL